MKIVALANLQWYVQCPSWFRLVKEGTPVDLLFNGDHWYLTDGVRDVIVPNRDTGARMLSVALDREAARSGP